MTKTALKLYDGIKVIQDDITIEVKHIADLWELFKWDINNDQTAYEASLEVTRNLIGFGFVDLTCAMPEGHTLTIEVIPCRD